MLNLGECTVFASPGSEGERPGPWDILDGGIWVSLWVPTVFGPAQVGQSSRLTANIMLFLPKDNAEASFPQCKGVSYVSSLGSQTKNQFLFYQTQGPKGRKLFSKGWNRVPLDLKHWLLGGHFGPKCQGVIILAAVFDPNREEIGLLLPTQQGSQACVHHPCEHLDISR